MCLCSPISINWYRRKLGAKHALHATHESRVRGLVASSAWCLAEGYWNGDRRRPMGYCGSGSTLAYLLTCRVFIDGDYNEPPPHMIPPTPMVEEINDCKCVVMWHMTSRDVTMTSRAPAVSRNCLELRLANAVSRVPTHPAGMTGGIVWITVPLESVTSYTQKICHVFQSLQPCFHISNSLQSLSCF